MHTVAGKHKNEHNRQKVREMPRNIIDKFWSIIDSSLVIHLYYYNTRDIMF